MPLAPHHPLGRLLHRFALWRWAAAARRAQTSPLRALRAQRYQARQLRAVLTDLCHIADSRLALPQVGSALPPMPAGSDWAWRPSLWAVPLRPHGWAGVPDKTPISADITLFHDCTRSTTSARQIRNLRPDDRAPFALQLDQLHFDGNYLSIVVNLPEAACTALTRQHLVELQVTLASERPASITARLNVAHGPNVEQILRPISNSNGENMIVFDLKYTDLVDLRAQRMWLDLVIERPQMQQITLLDLTLCRYLRAQF